MYKREKKIISYPHNSCDKLFMYGNYVVIASLLDWKAF